MGKEFVATADYVNGLLSERHAYAVNENKRGVEDVEAELERVGEDRVRELLDEGSLDVSFIVNFPEANDADAVVVSIETVSESEIISE